MSGKCSEAVVIAAWVALASCPKGQTLYNNDCVIDIQPEISPPVQPSDEKPPKDKMPSYQREGVQVIDAPSTTAEDAKEDQEKSQADFEGKKAANLLR